MGDKAISSLIATVLMILITIAAVGIITQAVIPMIKGNIESASQCDNAKIEVNTEMGYTCYDPSVNIVSISVSRGPENVAINGIQIKLVDSSGQSQIAEVISGGNYTFIDSTQMPEANSEKSFNINASVLNLTNIERVSVIPIIKIGKTSKVCSSSGVVELPRCSSAATFQQTVPPQGTNLWQGLMGYWKLDDTGAIAMDSTGKNNGTIIGATSAAGIIGTSINFGNTNTIRFADRASLRTWTPSSGFTVSAWVYPTSYFGENLIFAHGMDGGYQYYFTSNGAAFRLQYFSLPSWESPPITINLPLNQWHHLVAEYVVSGGIPNSTFYVNGALYYNYSYTTGNMQSPASGESLYIGSNRDYTGGSRSFSGRIDEVGFWNKTLSPQEISRLYNGGAGRTYP